MSNKLVPSLPLSQTPFKQLQQTQILAPLPPISTLPIYPLHHGKDSVEDETHPEQQEPEPELQEPEPEKLEPEPEQQEPEPEQQSELEFQRAKLTHHLYKSAGYFEKLKKDYSSRSTCHYTVKM